MERSWGWDFEWWYKLIIWIDRYAFHTCITIAALPGDRLWDISGIFVLLWWADSEVDLVLLILILNVLIVADICWSHFFRTCRIGCGGLLDADCLNLLNLVVLAGLNTHAKIVHGSLIRRLALLHFLDDFLHPPALWDNWFNCKKKKKNIDSSFIFIDGILRLSRRQINTTNCTIKMYPPL